MQALRWIFLALATLALVLAIDWLLRDPGRGSVLALILALGAVVQLAIERARSLGNPEPGRASRPHPMPSATVPFLDRSPRHDPNVLWTSRPEPRVVHVDPRDLHDVVKPIEPRDIYPSTIWFVALMVWAVMFFGLLLTLRAWQRAPSAPPAPEPALVEDVEPEEEPVRRRRRRR